MDPNQAPVNAAGVVDPNQAPINAGVDPNQPPVNAGGPQAAVNAGGPPAAPNQAPQQGNANANAVIHPRVGGVIYMGTNQVAWCGGGNTVTNTHVTCYSKQALRPNDQKAAFEQDRHMRWGFTEVSDQLGTVEEMKSKTYEGPTLKEWVDSLSQQFLMDGRDTMFWIYDSVNDEEFDMLEDWGKATKDNIDAYVNYLENQADPYDHENLISSGHWILKSISRALKRRLATVTRKTGPHYLFTILRHHQSSSSVAVRNMVRDLEGMKLKNEPKMDVVSFNVKITEQCQRIENTATPMSLPHDLAEIVARLYTGTGVITFEMVVSQELANATNGVVVDWREVLENLAGNYEELLSTNMWPPAQEHKEDALMSRIRALEARTNVGGGSDKRKCFICDKVGHIARNCPDRPNKGGNGNGGGNCGNGTGNRDNGGGSNVGNSGGGNSGGTPSGGNAGTGGGGGNGGRSWMRKPPADHDKAKDYAQEKNDQTYHWCHTCRRWTSGKSRHFTRQHVKKDNSEQSAGGGLAGVDSFDPNLSFFGGSDAFGGAGFCGATVPISSLTVRPKEWKACKCCNANTPRARHCDGTICHQQGCVKNALHDGLDF